MNTVWIVVIKHKLSQNEFIDSVWADKFSAQEYIDDLKSTMDSDLEAIIEDMEVRAGGFNAKKR